MDKVLIELFLIGNLDIILCGPPCTGKTSTLKVLVESLSELGKDLPIINQNNAVFKQQKFSNNLHKIKR